MTRLAKLCLTFMLFHQHKCCRCKKKKNRILQFWTHKTFIDKLFLSGTRSPLDTAERYVLGICMPVDANHALTLRCGGVMLSRCDTVLQRVRSDCEATSGAVGGAVSPKQWAQTRWRWKIRRLMNQTELKHDGLGSHDDEGGGEMQMAFLFGILFLLKKIKRFGGKAPRFRWQVSSSRARIRRQRIFTASISNLPLVMFFSPCAWTFLFRGDKEHSERAWT